MWSFQWYFRIGVRRAIEQALEKIGLPVEVRVVLVGVAHEGGLRHQLCIEPEDGPLSLGHVAAVSTRARELFEADPESKLMISNPPLHELRRQHTFRRSRAAALVEAIESSAVFEGFTFFASNSAPIDGYEVHTCVGVPTAPLDSLPALDDSVVDRVYVGRSLQHQVITECLRRADNALYLPDPGMDLSPLGVTDDIVNAATVRLTEGMAYRATKRPADLFPMVNAFASLSYERAGAGGHLVIADREMVADRLRVRFRQPISLGDARSIRKLLELSDDSTSLLADSSSAYGLGSSSAAPDVIEICVSGHAEWELSVNGSALLRVAYGRATLPRPLIDLNTFNDIAERTVGSIESSRIREIVQRAHVNGHGTTLVISSDPVGEADRLGGEAVTIETDCLELADIVRFGRVDGAVLLGPDGRCHAFGVILDGTATVRGDRARGSRFNSAVRYQRTSTASSMLVVISADGTVDLIPRLRPRVPRDEVEAAVRAFHSCCEADDVDSEEFARTHGQVKGLAFYLDDAQCRRANECYENEMRRRFEMHGFRISETPLRPDPEMNESYFL